MAVCVEPVYRLSAKIVLECKRRDLCHLAVPVSGVQMCRRWGAWLSRPPSYEANCTTLNETLFFVKKTRETPR
jgi:hypothetical protein